MSDLLSTHSVERWRSAESADIDATSPTPLNHGSGIEHTTDQIAEEAPVALVFNGIAYSVMMATPDALDCFALGFSLSEGIVESVDEVYSTEVVSVELALGVGFQVNIEISQRRAHALKERKRNLSGRTGCGLCGTESLASAIRPINTVNAQPLVSHDAINRAVMALRDHQHLQQKTGAVHCAAWCDESGTIVSLFEDVGRHNALDKLIGERSQSAASLNDGFVVLSSRGSYEMIHKSAAASVSTLVTLSAPTGLAVRLAKQANINLVGLAKPNKQVIYHRAQTKE